MSKTLKSCCDAYANDPQTDIVQHPQPFVHWGNKNCHYCGKFKMWVPSPLKLEQLKARQDQCDLITANKRCTLWTNAFVAKIYQKVNLSPFENNTWDALLKEYSLSE